MPFQDFQPIAAFATTPTAVRLLQRLAGVATLWLPDSLLTEQTACPNSQIYTGSLKDHLAQLWSTQRSLIFCLATGAVVRLIAPLLKDKTTDPAVVVIDETGQFVISLCGGHQQGADRLTRLIAQQLGATAVLTGAANRANLPGIDVLGQPFGWTKGSGDWTAVSAAIAQDQPVRVIQEAGSKLWQQHLSTPHPFLLEAVTPPSEEQAKVWISAREQRITATATIPQVQWHPRVLWVGLGCERGTAKPVIEQAVKQLFQTHDLARGAIAGLATIDLKADETGLLEFCRDANLPLVCFPADQLRTIPVPNPSPVVAAEVGTPSVAEAAALLASQQSAVSGQPVEGTLIVPKQVFRLAGQPGAVTLAVAQAEREYIGRSGNLWLVGTGPGALEQITPAAQNAITQADVVIGYSLYVDLIRPLLRPGQIVEAWPITQERQRAERAIALARWGLTVAVISSGDCGIYGMAGLVLETLQNQGWEGQTPSVEVFPGISALQSAAARVGAPLMHDFCAISLSDLLTPWEVIDKRLQAAAQADFVVALYNPRSKTRTHQIERVQQIFLQWRSPDTPVALVQSAYRPDEQIRLTTLADFLNHPIDMLTTVLIGNQSTRTLADWMITPRGYLGFTSENSK